MTTNRAVACFVCLSLLVPALEGCRDEPDVGEPPAGFALLSPEDGAVDVPRQPTLEWAESDGATAYTVLMSQGADLVAPVVLLDHQPRPDAGLTLLQPLAYDTLYTWEVIASNAAGEQVSDADSSFTTLASPPAAFDLVSPGDGAKDVPVRPTFRWASAPRATGYTIEVTDDAGTSVVAVDVATTEYTLAESEALDRDTTYQWRVTAHDLAGDTPSSAAFQLTTIPPEPDGFSLRAPADGEDGVDPRPMLRWQAVSDVTDYSLVLADNADLTDPVLEVDGLPWWDSTYYVDVDLAGHTTYYWRVTAHNEGGSTPCAQDFSFTVGGGGLETITVEATTSTVAVGRTTQFVATGHYVGGESETLTSGVTWNLTQPAFASIGASGLATGLAAGTTEVVAAVGDVSGRTTLTVTAAELQELDLAPVAPKLALGSDLQLQLTGHYSDGTVHAVTTGVGWASGTEAVATVDEDGLVTSERPGDTVITATVGDVSVHTVVSVSAEASSLLGTWHLGPGRVVSPAAWGGVEYGEFDARTSNGGGLQLSGLDADTGLVSCRSAVWSLTGGVLVIADSNWNLTIALIDFQTRDSAVLIDDLGNEQTLTRVDQIPDAVVCIPATYVSQQDFPFAQQGYGSGLPVADGEFLVPTASGSIAALNFETGDFAHVSFSGPQAFGGNYWLPVGYYDGKAWLSCWCGGGERTLQANWPNANGQYVDQINTEAYGHKMQVYAALEDADQLFLLGYSHQEGQHQVLRFSKGGGYTLEDVVLFSFDTQGLAIQQGKLLTVVDRSIVEIDLAGNAVRAWQFPNVLGGFYAYSIASDGEYVYLAGAYDDAYETMTIMQLELPGF